MGTDLLFRIRAIFRRSRVEQELDEELRFHLDRQAEKHFRTGTAPQEAARRARLDLGGLDQVKEETRDARGVSAIEASLRDLRYAARVLRKSPAFTAVAVLSLALGMGANTAIFQLVDAVRLRTLPVQNPGELAEVRIGDRGPAGGNFNRDEALTNPIWEQVREHRQSFSSIFAWADDAIDISPGEEIRVVPNLWVSGAFFSALHVQPLVGRVFTPADDRRGCGFPGAVISYAFWQREFGGVASAVGRKLSIGAIPVEIIGVTPASFFGLEVGQSFDVALPICSEAALRGASSRLDDGNTWWLTVMGRLKPGTSLERATSQLASLSPGVFAATLPARYPPQNIQGYLGMRLEAVPAATGISRLRGQYSDPLWLLLALAAFVLLIACANLANLMLARSSAREREIAVRLAIGASRGGIIRQLMVESLLIASAGAALGLLLARNLSQLLVALLTTQGSLIFVDLHQDWRVLGFTSALAVVTCVLFGLTPALRATRTAPRGAVKDLSQSLKAGSRGMTANRERFGLRRVLVASQVALSLVLLVGALLFVRSLQNLQTVNPGFQPDGILIAHLSLARLNLQATPMRAARQDLVERLRATAGVTAAAEARFTPLSGNAWDEDVWLDGSDSHQRTDTYFNQVGAGYFHTLGTPWLAGRDFGPHDTSASPKVAIVNEAFARRLAHGANPVGKRFWVEATSTEPETAYEIVGMVGNTKYHDLREPFGPLAWLPQSQNPRPLSVEHILIRSNVPIDRVAPSVKAAVAAFDPSIRYSFQVFKTQIHDSLVRERLMATLSSAFGILAGLLSAIGLYGVISYMVARRRNEIGIRMALGAGRREILYMVLGESAILLASGLAAGTVVSLAAANAAASMLFGLKPYDAATILMAVGVLSLVALAASYVPARRAAKLDPMIALRDE